MRAVWAERASSALALVPDAVMPLMRSVLRQRPGVVPWCNGLALLRSKFSKGSPVIPEVPEVQSMKVAAPRKAHAPLCRLIATTGECAARPAAYGEGVRTG
jgi:hypothetical protein